MVEGRTISVHRFAYEAVHGPIPDGLTVDHICGRHTCVHPGHLRLLSAGDNVRVHWQEQREMCRNGLHPIAETGTLVVVPNRERPSLRCEACYAIRKKRTVASRQAR